MSSIPGLKHSEIIVCKELGLDHREFNSRWGGCASQPEEEFAGCVGRLEPSRVVNFSRELVSNCITQMTLLVQSRSDDQRPHSDLSRIQSVADCRTAAEAVRDVIMT